MSAESSYNISNVKSVNNILKNQMQMFCNPRCLINLLPEPLRTVFSDDRLFEDITNNACDIAFDLEREPYVINLINSVEEDDESVDRIYFFILHAWWRYYTAASLCKHLCCCCCC